jgi:tetratricopeptide (TPR) repeat protein
LIKTADGLHLWSQRFDRDAADIFAVQDEVARAVVTALQGKLLTPDSATGTSTRNAEAYDAYLQGRFFWNQRSVPNLRRAISFFELALERDPDFAEAWVGLADVYLMLPFYSTVPTREVVPKAQQAAEKALAINEGLAEAHTTLAYVLALYHWDWEASDQEFRRALELNPRYTTALKWYSDVLSFMGRDQEALEAVQLAAKLDPLSPNIQTILGKWYWFAGRPDEAMAQFNKALELDPVFPLALMHKSWLCWSLSDMEGFFATREQLEKVSKRGEVPASELRRSYAGGGPEAVLLLQVNAPEAKYFPVDRARWHSLLGDLDAAFRDLDQASEERPPWLPFIVDFPELEPLRSDSRYQVLLDRLGLPKRVSSVGGAIPERNPGTQQGLPEQTLGG